VVDDHSDDGLPEVHQGRDRHHKQQPAGRDTPGQMARRRPEAIVAPFALNRSCRLLLLEGSRGPVASNRSFPLVAPAYRRGRDEDRGGRSSLGRASLTTSRRPPNSLPSKPFAAARAFRIIAHRHECETSWLACFSIGYDLNFCDAPNSLSPS
jgi:hypothetical protein